MIYCEVAMQELNEILPFQFTATSQQISFTSTEYLRTGISSINVNFFKAIRVIDALRPSSGVRTWAQS